MDIDTAKGVKPMQAYAGAMLHSGQKYIVVDFIDPDHV